MSDKLAPLLLAGSGAAAASVGGLYLLNRGALQATSSDELDDFRKKNKEDDCVMGLFNSVGNLSDLKGSAEITETSLSGDTTFFGDQSTEENKNKSCLLIKTNKQDYTVNDSSKWKGNISWSWSFMNNDKGFITFNVAKSSSSDKKLNVIGGFYLLEKELKQWKIKHHKEVREDASKKIDADNFDTAFPKFKSGVGAFNNTTPFVADKSKLNDICGEDECKDDPKPTPTPTSNKWLWKWVDKGTEKVGDWSDNLKWWENIYGKENFDLKEKINDFSGKWETSTETD